MQEHQDDAIWQDLLNLVFSFVNDEMESKVDAGLKIFTGLFSYIIEHVQAHTEDLGKVFEKTLGHPSLDIKLTALQATCAYLGIGDRKHTKPFKLLLPLMTNVIHEAMVKEDETVLEDALVEFNELAEVEPGFFKTHFKQLFGGLKEIAAKSDFDNPTIRHQPIEFIVTLIERLPSVIKKDLETLKDLLETIFKLMIDIPEEIDEEWLTPKEGFATEEDEEDNVKFGQGCVDRLVSCLGEELMLPLTGQLVTNTIANDVDWRYKHAGIMAFSQIGEYIEEASKISAMIPVLVEHLQHPNPKIRYASLHSIGQLADDMPKDFQEAYHTTIIPALLAALDDPVPRVQAHACAACTNFFENVDPAVLKPYTQVICTKLCAMIKNGISIIKENAVTTLATTAERNETEFAPYFKETLEFLIGFLNEFSSSAYKQFRGQTIEGITLICAAVGEETFKPLADDVIKVLLHVQNNQLDTQDCQRIYLLSSW
jgi:hypothetical protein